MSVADTDLLPGAYVRTDRMLAEVRQVSESGAVRLEDRLTGRVFSVPRFAMSGPSWRLVRPAPTVGDTLEDELARCAA